VAERVIEAQGLTRRFGQFVAANDVALHVEAGEVFGLLGANGAGKTTTIRMLCGLLPPTAGRITVDGVDMVHHARRARGRIGYVSQRFALYSDLTVLENLRLAAGLYGLSGARRDERIQWAVATLELEARQQSMAGDLPLGYKKRLALAAALLHDPRVLFLDEPTSGVDPFARQRFWELIYDLADTGMGVLVTTHYMDEALFCDRLVLMQAGRIVIEGTPEGLLRRPLATPMLEVLTPNTVTCARELETWDEVLEIIPHAGHLRVRLHAGADLPRVSDRLRGTESSTCKVTEVRTAQPLLEDVFVAVLEEAETGAGQIGRPAARGA
jgi:ABC-2 type transport system ATP-binding protein